MDARLRALGREVRAAPGDLEHARRYRAALTRLGASGDAEAQAELDRLCGVFVEPTSRALALGAADEPRWPPLLRRVGLGRDAPLLLPSGPSRGPLTLAWEARGRALAVTAGCVLLEGLDHALEARCPRSGALLWSVPSARPDAAHLVGFGEEEERAGALPWAVAPWGAIELVARYHAPLRYRRVGRHHPELGRVTERRPFERADAEVELQLTVVVPEGSSWGAAPPERVEERAGGGEGLCEGDLRLPDWDVDLDELRLCPDERLFVVRTSDEPEWAVYALDGGGARPTGVHPTWFDVPAEPWPLPAADAARDGPVGAPWEVAAGALRRAGGGPPLALPHVAPGRSALLPVDGANLLLTRGRDGAARLERVPWGASASEPLAAAWPDPEALEGCKLVPWTAADEVHALERATVLAAYGRLVLQVEDTLRVYAPPEGS